MTQTPRTVYLDLAKTIGIVLVVFGHTRFYGDPLWAEQARNYIYTFHMPLFLFISGMVYSRYSHSDNYRDFISKKSIRLIVPYLTVSILLICIKLTTDANMETFTPVSHRSFIHMFYKPEAGYFLWFIYTLWILFLLIPPFKSRRARIYLLGLSFILMCIPCRLPDVFCLNQLKNLSFYFILGCVATDYLGTFEIILSKKKLGTALFLITSIIFVLFTDTIAGKIAECAMPFLGTLWVLQSSHYFEQHVFSKSQPAFIILASSSVFFIYLFHTLFMGLQFHILKQLNFNSSILLITVGNISMIAIGFIGPIGIYWFMTKHPSRINLLLGIPTYKKGVLN